MGRNALTAKIFAGLSLLILVLPLINQPPWISPPAWGKSLAFRILFSLVLLLLSLVILGETRLRLIERVRQRIVRAKVALALLAGLFLAVFLSSVFSVDPSFSFWGSPLRGGGSVTLLSLITASFFAFAFFSRKHWGYAWDITFITGSLVALVAVFQWQGWFSAFIISKETRPMSTLGNDIQLAIYLIVLLFPAFVFFLKERLSTQKKALYFLAFLLFLLVIVITGSRGAYLGVFLGFSYFILLYPFQRLRHSLALKFVFLGVMLIPALMVYYANTLETFPRVIRENTTLSTIAGRLQLKQVIVEEPRFSTWKVGWEAIKARPLLGYGPENFDVAFDEHYDPKLPNIQYVPDGSNTWWDRAHNVLVDTAVQMGIPALLFYLAFLGTLFWRLEKLKGGGDTILAHGLQATLVAYFAALLFGFDVFSTLLAFFFVTAYILHVTSKESEPNETPRAKPLPDGVKIPAIAAALILFLFFTWQYDLRPLSVNKEVNYAFQLSRQGECDASFQSFEKVLKDKGTFLDNYVRLKYFDALRSCPSPQLSTFEVAKKGYEIMGEAAAFRPTHSRTWIFLGQLAGAYAEQGIKTRQISPEQAEDLIAQAVSHYEKAVQLTPKHQEIYMEWVKTYFVAGEYEKAKEKADECIAINENTGACWWLKGIAEEYLGEHENSERDIKIAGIRGHRINDLGSLVKLAEAYVSSENYEKLAETYGKLIELEPDNAQFLVSLAVTYKELGNFYQASVYARKVLEVDPATEPDVQAFLRSIGY